MNGIRKLLLEIGENSELVLKAAKVRGLRDVLHMSQSEFARFMGADRRTVIRWEKCEAGPCGTSNLVISALIEVINTLDHKKMKEFLDFIHGTINLGGLSYLIVKLFSLWLSVYLDINKLKKEK